MSTGCVFLLFSFIFIEFLTVCLSVCKTGDRSLSLCLSVRLSSCPSVRLSSLRPSVRLSVCPSVRLFFCSSGWRACLCLAGDLVRLAGGPVSVWLAGCRAGPGRAGQDRRTRQEKKRRDRTGQDKQTGAWTDRQVTGDRGHGHRGHTDRQVTGEIRSNFNSLYITL